MPPDRSLGARNSERFGLLPLDYSEQSRSLQGNCIVHYLAEPGQRGDGLSVPAKTTDQAPTPLGKAEPATRRRGVELETAIYAAVFELLGAVGYARLTMDGVAIAAHTGKAALYRRWPDKNALIVDALRASLPSPVDVSSRRSLREDMLALLMRIRDALESSYGVTFQALKAEPGPCAGLVHAAVRERVFAPYRELVIRALTEAAARGEVRSDAIATQQSATLVANVGPAMLIHRHFLEGPDLPDEFVVSVIDEVVMPMLRP